MLAGSEATSEGEAEAWTEGPNIRLYSSLYRSIENRIPHFSKFPKYRLVFITIKDNKQRAKWKKIDTVRRLIARNFSSYIIVRGLLGGVHWHCLATVADPLGKWIPKGIHVRLEPLQKARRINKFNKLNSYMRSFTNTCLLNELNEELLRTVKRLRPTTCRINMLAERSELVGSCVRYLIQNLKENNPHRDELFSVHAERIII